MGASPFVDVTNKIETVVCTSISPFLNDRAVGYIGCSSFTHPSVSSPSPLHDQPIIQWVSMSFIASCESGCLLRWSWNNIFIRVYNYIQLVSATSASRGHHHVVYSSISTLVAASAPRWCYNYRWCQFVSFYLRLLLQSHLLWCSHYNCRKGYVKVYLTVKILYILDVSGEVSYLLSLLPWYMPVERQYNIMHYYKYYIMSYSDQHKGGQTL